MQKANIFWRTWHKTKACWSGKNSAPRLHHPWLSTNTVHKRKRGFQFILRLKEFFAMIYAENCTSNSLLQSSLLVSCQSSSSTARGYRFTSQRKKLHPLLAFLSAEFVSWPNLPWLSEHVKKALPWLGPGLTTDLRRVRRPHWHSGGVTPPLLKQTMGGVTEEFTFVVIEGGVERLGFFL